MVTLKRHRHFEIGINKSGKWYWKPQWGGTRENFHKMENGKGFKFMNTWSYYVPTSIELFWLKFIFYVKMKPRRVSGEKRIKYVDFKKTHLGVMDLPEGNWNE